MANDRSRTKANVSNDYAEIVMKDLKNNDKKIDQLIKMNKELKKQNEELNNEVKWIKTKLDKENDNEYNKYLTTRKREITIIYVGLVIVFLILLLASILDENWKLAVLTGAFMVSYVLLIASMFKKEKDYILDTFNFMTSFMALTMAVISTFLYAMDDGSSTSQTKEIYSETISDEKMDETVTPSEFEQISIIETEIQSEVEQEIIVETELDTTNEIETVSQ